MTEKVVFLFAALLIFLTVFWLLGRKLPNIGRKHGIVRNSTLLMMLFSPVTAIALNSSEPVFLFSALCVALLTAPALMDNRVGTTLFELYPVMIGLAGALVVVSDFILPQPSLHITMYGSVIGLFAGLGTAVLASIAETALSVKDPFSLHAIEMCSVAGFFAGYPGVLWVMGLSVLLCFAARFYNKRVSHRLSRLCYNGCISYALLLYLCLHSVFGL